MSSFSLVRPALHCPSSWLGAGCLLYVHSTYDPLVVVVGSWCWYKYLRLILVIGIGIRIGIGMVWYGWAATAESS